MEVCKLSSSGLQEWAKAELLGRVEPWKMVTSWVSGSLLEGLGNQSSDVDIFVLVPHLSDELPATRRDPDHCTYAFISDETRFDIEFWAEDNVCQLASKLDSVRLDDPEFNSNHYLKYWESEFIHRLAVGVPLVEQQNFCVLKGRFNIEKFSRYLLENCLRMFDDAFDDAVGMIASSQENCGALRARDAMCHAIDSLLYASGCTNDKAKFRSLKLRRLVDKFEPYRQYETAFWQFQSVLPEETQHRRLYAERVLAFSSDLVGMVQDQVSASVCSSYYAEHEQNGFESSSQLPESLLRSA